VNSAVLSFIVGPRRSCRERHSFVQVTCSSTEQKAKFSFSLVSFDHFERAMK